MAKTIATMAVVLTWLVLGLGAAMGLLVILWAVNRIFRRRGAR